MKRPILVTSTKVQGMVLASFGRLTHTFRVASDAVRSKEQERSESSFPLETSTNTLATLRQTRSKVMESTHGVIQATFTKESSRTITGTVGASSIGVTGAITMVNGIEGFNMERVECSSPTGR